MELFAIQIDYYSRRFEDLQSKRVRVCVRAGAGAGGGRVV